MTSTVGASLDGRPRLRVAGGRDAGLAWVPVHPSGLVYRGLRLDGPLGEFHQAVDALEADTVPESYYRKVLASRYRGRAGSRSTADGGR